MYMIYDVSGALNIRDIYPTLCWLKDKELITKKQSIRLLMGNDPFKVAYCIGCTCENQAENHKYRPEGLK